MSMIEFDTTPFERSHNKLPRGYGSWAFCEERRCDGPSLFFAPSSTYKDAKKFAKQRMQTKYGGRCRGVLYVCP